MPSLPYTIADTGPLKGILVWDEPETNATGPVHSICGHDYTVDACYRSDSGSDIMAIRIRLNGAPPDIVKIGQTFPDIDGTPYVIVGRMEYDLDTLKAIDITAAREDVYLKAMEDVERVKRRAASGTPADAAA